MAQHGAFVWNELHTGDTAKAKEFYTALLGWNAKEAAADDSMQYTEFENDGVSIGGMADMAGAENLGASPHWMPYIAVDDVDASAARARELGAELKIPPMGIPKVGRFCVIADPLGAVAGLITLAEPIK
ncbi:MAG: VOC family protein [Sphingomonadales bacterium]